MEFLPVNSEDVTPLDFPGKYFDTNAWHQVRTNYYANKIDPKFEKNGLTMG
jgi:hypothetical protein